MGEYYNNYLSHHGIKGQKWGVRRYQRKDGTLTKAGLKRKKILDDAVSSAKKKASDAKTELDNFTKTYKPKKLSDSAIEKLRKKDFGNDPVETADEYARDAGYKDHKDMYTQQNDSYGKDRTANLHKKIKFYEDAVKEYGSMKVAEIDKEAVKKAEKFVKDSDILHYTGDSEYQYNGDIEFARKRYGLQANSLR